VDFFEKLADSLKSAWTNFGSFWETFTWRERIWVGGTIGAVTFGALFGGTMVTGAMVTGFITFFGLAWIATYSPKFMAALTRNREGMDIVMSLILLCAPFYLGTALGLLVVFANLFITTGLIFLSCHERTLTDKQEEQAPMIDVEAVPA
jgi:hypothetical protein